MRYRGKWQRRAMEGKKVSTPHTRDKKCLRRTARAASNHVPAVFSSIVGASNHVPVHSAKSGNAQVRGLEHRVSSKVRQAHALSSQLAPQILTTQDFERGGGRGGVLAAAVARRIRPGGLLPARTLIKPSPSKEGCPGIIDTPQLWRAEFSTPGFMVGLNSSLQG